MARYTVHGATRRECQEALDELSRLLDVQVTLRPTNSLGGSWIARATQEAPDQEVRGLVVR
ncbi:hypothetical protein [Streptomyces sp. NPDC058629]|uniref:hypothetical protein n=1 Tax=Streptomyces sp. NPDC058629 TaxID=3346565 RepID=UPI0036543AB5